MSLSDRLTETSMLPDPDGLDDPVPETVAPKAQLAVINDERDLGPAMQALNPRQRVFVEELMVGTALAEAYRRAGYNPSTPQSATRAASRLARSDPIIAAMTELTKARLRLEAPAALKAVTEILADKHHPQRAKVAENVLSRLDPVVSKVDAHVTHEVIDHTAEAVQELRMLKSLGVARDKLEEMFGFTGLQTYERILAEEDAKRASQAKLIEGEVIETEGQSND